FGISREQAGEFDWVKFIHPDDRKGFLSELMTALRKLEPFHARARMRRDDGTWRWIESRGNAITDANGLTGYIGSSVDITEIYESQERLKELDQRKDEFLANMSHEIRSPLTG